MVYLLLLDVLSICMDTGVITNGWKNPPSGPYQCGQTVRFTCDMGFMLVGDSLLKCTQSGQFDKRIPECVATGGIIRGQGLFPWQF